MPVTPSTLAASPNALRTVVASEAAANVRTAYNAAVADLHSPADAVELWLAWRPGLTAALTPTERDDAWTRLTRRVHELWTAKHTAVWLKKGVATADALASRDLALREEMRAP